MSGRRNSAQRAGFARNPCAAGHNSRAKRKRPAGGAPGFESLRMLHGVFGRRMLRAMSRHLYLVGYDVADPKRLRRMLACVKRHATGGQRSVFECWLNDAERRDLLHDTGRLLRPSEDRFFLVRLDPRQKPELLGLAAPVVDDALFYLG